jgi:hypothetical protein
VFKLDGIEEIAEPDIAEPVWLCNVREILVRFVRLRRKL